MRPHPTAPAPGLPSAAGQPPAGAVADRPPLRRPSLPVLPRARSRPLDVADCALRLRHPHAVRRPRRTARSGDKKKED